MIVHRFQDYAEQPWKNGQGVTREIARAALDGDVDGDADAFLWRLSLADVSQSGPFSPFTGYDRTITLISGDGFTLGFADGTRHVLDTPGEPYDFDGGAELHCTLLGGPSRDLNLMVRRGRAQTRRHVIREPGRHAIAADDGAAVFIVFPVAGEARMVPGNGHAETLGRWDTALLAPGEAATLDTGPDSAVFCATVAWR